MLLAGEKLAIPDVIDADDEPAALREFGVAQIATKRSALD